MKGIAYYNEDFFTVKEDEELLQENIARILLTSPGERINNPYFGCKLKQFLFEFDSYIIEDIKFEIKSAIEKWEPRATVQNVIVSKKDVSTFYILVEAISNSTNNLISYETIINL